MSAGVLPLLNLRRHEIATVLNIGVTKVDQLIRAEAFPSFKLGGTRLARYEDVLAFNDSQADKSLAELKDADDTSRRTNPSSGQQTAPAAPAASSTVTAGRVVPLRRRRGAR